MPLIFCCQSCCVKCKGGVTDSHFSALLPRVRLNEQNSQAKKILIKPGQESISYVVGGNRRATSLTDLALYLFIFLNY